MKKQLSYFTLSLLIIAISTSVTAQTKTNFNIKDYGAVGDGKTLDSPAINKAIEEASKLGGGTVYVPAGIYLSGSIRLKNNINLFLDAGSVILAAPVSSNVYDACEYFELPAFQDGGHTYFHNSLIWGENLNNVSISGGGTIDGIGLEPRAKLMNKLVGFVQINGIKPDVSNLPDISTVRLGNKSIALKSCTNVRIEDITMIRGGHFAILVTGCNLLTIDNVIIDTNRDGIDIDCCTNTTVSNCFVNSPDDDAIVIKSSFALKKRVLTENLTITNCQVSGFKEGTLLNGQFLPGVKKNGRIKFGTESNGGYRNCVLSNCTFRSSKGIALEEVDGGIMENISISNITMMDVDDYPIYITLGDRNRDPDSTRISIGRNISISNIIAEVNDSLSGIHITGTPTSKLEDIRLSNIHITYKGGGTKKEGERQLAELGKRYPEVWVYKQSTPSYGVFARHVKNLLLDNISVDYINEDLRPPMICSDIDGLEIYNYKAEVAKGIVPAIFNKISNMTILNSPILDKVKW